MSEFWIQVFAGAVVSWPVFLLGLWISHRRLSRKFTSATTRQTRAIQGIADSQTGDIRTITDSQTRDIRQITEAQTEILAGIDHAAEQAIEDGRSNEGDPT